MAPTARSPRLLSEAYGFFCFPFHQHTPEYWAGFGGAPAARAAVAATVAAPATSDTDDVVFNCLSFFWRCFPEIVVPVVGLRGLPQRVHKRRLT